MIRRSKLNSAVSSSSSVAASVTTLRSVESCEAICLCHRWISPHHTVGDNSRQSSCILSSVILYNTHVTAVDYRDRSMTPRRQKSPFIHFQRVDCRPFRTDGCHARSVAYD